MTPTNTQTAPMIRLLRTTLTIGILTTPMTASAFLPELPFCPFGGPPGWFNRIAYDDAPYATPYYPRTPYYGAPYPYRPAPVVQNQEPIARPAPRPAFPVY